MESDITEKEKEALVTPPSNATDNFTIGDSQHHSRFSSDNSSKENSTMSHGFLKLIKSEILDDLLENDHNAFILLTIIAKRARRNSNPNCKNLKAGQALMGDYKKCGFERQPYRTALANLQTLQLVTIQPTNKGTIVTLLNSAVYDINCDGANQQTNQNLTSQQPTGNQQTNQRATTNKKIRKKESKEEKEFKNTIPHVKLELREAVKLTQAEYDHLVKDCGASFVDDMLDILSAYKVSKGVEYKKDYAVLARGGWVRREAEKMRGTAADSSNEELAKKYHGAESASYYVKACADCVEVTSKNAYVESHKLKYDDKSFKVQFESVLRKGGLWNILEQTSG